MPIAVYALMAGAFGIGVTEFVIMGLLLEVGNDLAISAQTAGSLISGYALGVVIGAPVFTIATARLPHKTTLLVLMVIFTLGNAACALAPNYWFLFFARVLTSFAHGTFFGVGSVVATRLVAKDKQASAIAVMFTGLTAANILGVPFGTFLGQLYGWRATFWAVTVIGVLSFFVIRQFVPANTKPATAGNDWRSGVRALANRSVVAGLMTTVFGFAGVFAVFTYIAPLLTQMSGFDKSALSPILIVFGLGLVIGNLLGGKLADRYLKTTVIGSLIALTIVLLLMPWAFQNQVLAVIAVGLFGVAAFSTVAPLQMWVLGKITNADQSLVSSLNIAAFNLGNALGAWAGGVVIAQNGGLPWIPYIAAAMPVASLLIAVLTMRSERPAVPAVAACAQS